MVVVRPCHCRGGGRVDCAMGKCGTCGFSPRGDQKGHTARGCVLKEFVCARSLPVGHPLKVPGECVRKDCICQSQTACSLCKRKGHKMMTQTYSPQRWKKGDNGGLKRKRHQKDLCREDFACPLMTDKALNDFLANARSNASEKADDGVRAVSNVSRIRGNTFQTELSVGGTADLMVENGSRASSLHPDNRAHFNSLSRHASLGAVAAGMRAASEIEGPMDATPAANPILPGPAPASDEEGVDDAVVDGPPHARLLPMKRKEVRAHMEAEDAARASRIARVVKSRRTGASGAVADLSAVVGVASASSQPAEPVAIASHWAPGVKEEFCTRLPSVRLPSVAALSPLAVAHRVLEGISQCALDEVDPVLRAEVETGAQRSAVRGLMLVSAGCTPAFIAERLCSTMAPLQQQSMLPVVAQWVISFVADMQREAPHPAVLNLTGN